jgi:hypothetical protein
MGNTIESLNYPFARLARTLAPPKMMLRCGGARLRTSRGKEGGWFNKRLARTLAPPEL